ncbi:hypothetical protein OAH15_01095 [bacterium]|nr:hypothetical protein [bacterium]
MVKSSIYCFTIGHNGKLLWAKYLEIGVFTWKVWRRGGISPLGRAIQFTRAEMVDLLRKNGGKTGKELKAELK